MRYQGYPYEFGPCLGSLAKTTFLDEMKTSNPINEKQKMKQIPVYVMDLTKIDGRGDFSCPNCGTTISPDDCTNETYSIGEAKVKNQSLEELEIRCNTCRSYLHLTGFSLLQKLPREY